MYSEYYWNLLNTWYLDVSDDEPDHEIVKQEEFYEFDFSVDENTIFDEMPRASESIELSLKFF